MLAQFGGAAGLRDSGLLDSALARPLNHRAYGEESLHSLAALYAAGVVRNHPFVDGNKRTGFMLAATFLEVNGWEVTATEESVVEVTRGLADGSVSDEAYRAWLEENTRAR
jgi:death-on-curing protein